MGSSPSSPLRFLGIACALLLVVSACKSGTTAGGGAARSIVIGTTDSLQNSFDPAQAYDYFGTEVVFNTAQTLVTYAPNAAKPSPLLAARLPDISADGLTYTFELRSGVKFQDGTSLDSGAVKFSLERARDFGARDSEAAGFLLSGIKDITTPSPTTSSAAISRAWPPGTWVPSPASRTTCRRRTSGTWRGRRTPNRRRPARRSSTWLAPPGSLAVIRRTATRATGGRRFPCPGTVRSDGRAAHHRRDVASPTGFEPVLPP